MASADQKDQEKLEEIGSSCNDPLQESVDKSADQSPAILNVVVVTGSRSGDMGESEECESDFSEPMSWDFDSIPVIRYKKRYKKKRSIRYPCEICAKTLQSPFALRAHMRIHTGERPFSCNECGQTFRYSTDLKAHSLAHSGRKHICHECGKIFVWARNLRSHLKLHTGIKPHVCKECGKSFAKSTDLKVHFRLHTGEKPYACDICGRSFTRFSGLYTHRWTHENRTKHECSECPKTFTRVESMKRHFKQFHGVERQIGVGRSSVESKPQKIDSQSPIKDFQTCQNSKSSERLIENCMKLKTQPDKIGPYQHVKDIQSSPLKKNCAKSKSLEGNTDDNVGTTEPNQNKSTAEEMLQKCTKSKSMGNKLESHSSHNGNFPNPPTSALMMRASLTPFSIEDYVMLQCEKSSFSIKVRKKKITNREKDNQNVGGCKLKQIQVNSVSSEIYQKASPDAMGALKCSVTKKRYPCEVCKKPIRPHDMSDHMRMHTGEKPFVCDLCGKSFCRATGLKNHIISHSGFKPYACEECGKEYTRRCDLRIHMWSHKGVKPYGCKECGKHYIAKYSLKCHMRSHSGEKPYKCETCGKRFSRNDSLKKHTLMHERQNRYECGSCGIIFTRPDTFKRHVRKKHMEPEPIQKAILEIEEQVWPNELDYP